MTQANLYPDRAVHGNCRSWFEFTIPDPLLTRRKRTLRTLPGSRWEVLGVDRHASQATIETAFRQRLGESFPDPELKLTRAYMRARRSRLDRAEKRDRYRARRKARSGPVIYDDLANTSPGPSKAKVKEVFEEIFGSRADNPTMTVVHSKAKRNDDGSINVTFGNKIALRF